MIYFETRHEALQCFPNAIVRKLLKGNMQGKYIAFNDCLTFYDYVNSFYVRG